MYILYLKKYIVALYAGEDDETEKEIRNKCIDEYVKKYEYVKLFL